MRDKAVRKELADKPVLLIGSPMCTPFSSMNNINYARMPPEEVKQRIEHGKKHFKFCMSLYEIQWKAKRHILHEHPQTASPWHEDCVVKIGKIRRSASGWGSMHVRLEDERRGQGRASPNENQFYDEFPLYWQGIVFTMSEHHEEAST